MKLLAIMAAYRTKDNRISRNDLCELTGLTDRKMRKLVSLAKKSGIPIISDSHNKGYYISYDPEAVHRMALEHRSRAYDHLETARALENLIPEEYHTWPVSIDEVE